MFRASHLNCTVKILLNANMLLVMFSMNNQMFSATWISSTLLAIEALNSGLRYLCFRIVRIILLEVNSTIGSLSLQNLPRRIGIKLSRFILKAHRLKNGWDKQYLISQLKSLMIIGVITTLFRKFAVLKNWLFLKSQIVRFYKILLNYLLNL